MVQKELIMFCILIYATMCTIRLTKTVLSAYENKRFWVNAYESHAYGHPDIQHLSGANDCTK